MKTKNKEKEKNKRKEKRKERKRKENEEKESGKKINPGGKSSVGERKKGKGREGKRIFFRCFDGRS